MAISFVGLTVSIKETGRNAPNYSVEGDLDGTQTLQGLLNFTKSALIQTADTALGEEQQRGFTKEPVTVVDGRQGKRVEDVSPLGKIQFVAKAIAPEFILEIYEGLLERSPVDTGLYKRNHVVFVNNQVVATDLASLKGYLDQNPDFKDKDQIRFVNIVPYARKLERHAITASGGKSRLRKSRDKKGRSGSHVLSENGTYFLTARAARRKFKANSQIRFELISGRSLAGINDVSFYQKSGKRMRKTFKKTGDAYVYPSIRIIINGNGIVGTA